MLAPSIFNSNLSKDFFNDTFDHMFQDMFRSPFERMGQVSCMSTDIQDLGDSYQMDMELPGYGKEDVKADLKDGYLTISAEHNSSHDEKDEKGNYVRSERYVGSCQRRFYVGEEIEDTDIRAELKEGILKIRIPKKEAKPAVEEKKYISIEG